MSTNEQLSIDSGTLPVRSAVPSRLHRRGWVVRRLLAASDILALVIAFAITELVFAGKTPVIDKVGPAEEIIIFGLTLPFWIVAAKLYGLYDQDEERASHSTTDELVSVFHLVTVAVVVFYAFSWISGLTSPDQAKLLTFWLSTICLMVAGRAGARTIARRHPSYVQNTVIVGAGDIGQLVGRKLLHHPEYGLQLVGFVDLDPKDARTDIGDLTILGGPSDLRKIVSEYAVNRVIIAFSRATHEDLLEIVHELGSEDVQIDVVPRLFDAVNPRASVHMVEGLPLVSLTPARLPRSSRFLKRCLDLGIASVLLVTVAPVMAFIALMIRRDSPGPVFFRQTRLGMDKREFELLKFRTMRVGTPEDAHRDYVRAHFDRMASPGPGAIYKVDQSADVTRFGRWLRKTSLDELPQLLNVLRGDMSLVGPRPCLAYEVELFLPHHFERFQVPAGLTGLWQVEARNHSSFGEALDLDVAYVRGWSLGLDLRLLARTPKVVFGRGHTN
ncbi:MAG TPA: sugar transferase [Gaiellaceae bacterium]|jgi:exopolysaccharide biosynthesis polyprenyl glycosylphosphotransferase